MKNIQSCILALLAIIFISPNTAADDKNSRVQPGYVRTQSFFNKKSDPLSEVMIRIDDKRINKSTDNGYFEINLDNHGDYFRIDSVFYPKNKNIKLLSNDMLREYVFNKTTPVLLIMMDENELDRQVDNATQMALAKEREKYERKLREIQENHELLDKEKEEQIAKLGQELAMMMEQQRKNARNFLSRSDYESADSLKKAIWEAIYMGDIEKVDSLNRLRGTIEEKESQLEDIRTKRAWELETAKSSLEAAEKYAKEEEHILNELIDMVRTSIIVATQQVKISKIQEYYKILMKYKPEAVDIIIEAGEFAENFLCDLESAETYYRRAVTTANQFDFDKTKLADCYLHLGNLYNLLGRYEEGKHYLDKALAVCNQNKKDRITYQIYLSLGDWENSWGSSAEASRMFELCLQENVKKNFTNEYTLASISKAVSLMESGNIKEANAILSTIPETNESNISIKDFSTVISTKVAHITYLLACYKAKEALEYCEETERLLKKVHSGDNHYTVSILISKARILTELNDFEGSAECLNKAISITRHIFGEEHPTYLNLLTSSAEQFIALGEYQYVEEALLKVIDSIMSLHDGTLKYTLRPRLALAHLYYETLESSKMLEQIQICEDILANSELNNELISEELNYLKYSQSGEYEDIKKCLESSLRSAEYAKREIGDKCKELAITYIQVSNAYVALEDMDRGIEYLKKGLEVYRDLYGKTDIRTMLCEMRYLIITARNEKKELANTLAYINKTEEVIINTLGENSLTLQQVYEPLIGYYSNANDITNASKYALKNLEVAENAYGKGHKMTIPALRTLSLCYSGAKNFREAEKYLNQAIDITEREYGYESELMTMCIGARIDLYINEGNAKEALLCLEDLEAIVTKKTGKKSIPYAGLLLLKSRIEISPEEREKLLHEVLDIYKQHFNERDYHFINIYIYLVQCYIAKHNFNKAEEYLNLASDIVKTVYDEGSKVEVNLLTEYCRLYIEQNRFDKASETIKKIRKIYSWDSVNNFELALFESQIYLGMGQTEKALDAIMVGREEVRKKYGDGSIWECQFLNKIAEIYIKLSDYEKATESLKQSIEISSTKLDIGINFNSAAYIELASIYVMHNPTTESCMEAKSIYRKIQLEQIKSLGSSHGFVGQLNLYLGQCDLNLYGHTHNLEYLKSARRYMESGKNIIENFYQGQANISLFNAYMCLANIMSLTGEAKHAINNYIKALECSRKIFEEDHINTITPIISLGNIYGNIGETDKALEYFDNAIEILEASTEKNDLMLMHVKKLKANTYEIRGDYESAIKNIIECIGILENYGEESSLAAVDCQMQLARVCARIGDSELVKEYIQKMLGDITNLNRMIPMQRYNMGYTFGCLFLGQVGDPDKAEECFLMAEAELQSVKGLLKNNEYLLYYNLAKTYELKEDRGKYKAYLEKAYKCAKKCSYAQTEQIDIIKEELESLKK